MDPYADRGGEYSTKRLSKIFLKNFSLPLLYLRGFHLGNISIISLLKVEIRAAGGPFLKREKSVEVYQRFFVRVPKE
jgi:hypothetical protein